MLPIFFYLVKKDIFSVPLRNVLGTIILLNTVFQTGRGGILILVAVSIVRLLYSSLSKVVTTVGVLVLVTGSIYNYILPIYYKDYYNVISFKLNIVKEINTGNFSHSPKVRLAEFRSIINEGIERPIKLLVGSGFGGYLESLSMEGLSKDDYSLTEIKAQRFYQVHSFLNYILLNFGFVGLITYLSSPIVLVKRAMLRSERMLLSMLAFPMIYSMFWRYDYIVIAFLIERLIFSKDE